MLTDKVVGGRFICGRLREDRGKGEGDELSNLTLALGRRVATSTGPHTKLLALPGIVGEFLFWWSRLWAFAFMPSEDFSLERGFPGGYFIGPEKDR